VLVLHQASGPRLRNKSQLLCALKISTLYCKILTLDSNMSATRPYVVLDDDDDYDGSGSDVELLDYGR
jgi:hypothetical protein